MPIYEYRCDACGHELDALQKINDAVLTDCPACDASALRRLISKPSFRLKGKGWYETDFKSDKETKRNLAGAKEEKPKSGDDKPAKKDGKSSDSGAKSSESKKSESKQSPSADKT